MRSSTRFVGAALVVGLVGGLTALGCGGSHHSNDGSTATNNAGTKTTGTGTTGTGTTGSTGTGSSDPHVEAALNQINASRATQNLPALTLDASMTSCGLVHAEDCASCANYEISNFTTCAHADFKAGNTCGGNSENQGVASGVSEDAGFTEIHQAMMAEGPPPAGQDNHYANIMNPSATAVGIGLYVDQNGTLWISEEFR